VEEIRVGVCAPGSTAGRSQSHVFRFAATLEVKKFELQGDLSITGQAELEVELCVGGKLLNCQNCSSQREAPQHKTHNRTFRFMRVRPQS